MLKQVLSPKERLAVRSPGICYGVKNGGRKCFTLLYIIPLGENQKHSPKVDIFPHSLDGKMCEGKRCKVILLLSEKKKCILTVYTKKSHKWNIMISMTLCRKYSKVSI